MSKKDNRSPEETYKRHKKNESRFSSAQNKIAHNCKSFDEFLVKYITLNDNKQTELNSIRSFKQIGKFRIMISSTSFPTKILEYGNQDDLKQDLERLDKEFSKTHLTI
jgi:hypothetical protein